MRSSSPHLNLKSVFRVRNIDSLIENIRSALGIEDSDVSLELVSNNRKYVFLPLYFCRACVTDILNVRMT